MHVPPEIKIDSTGGKMKHVWQGYNSRSILKVSLFKWQSIFHFCIDENINNFQYLTTVSVGTTFKHVHVSLSLQSRNIFKKVHLSVGGISTMKTRYGFLYFILVPPLRDLFYRECRDGLYSTGTFILTYAIHVLPFHIIASFIFSIIVYW